MAFVVQNDQIAGAPMVAGYPDGIGNTAIGRHASAAGFGLFTGSAVGESVDNSLAIHLDTYNNGSDDLPILEIQEGTDGSYTLFFDDDYAITLSGFTGDTMGWYSQASGDAFNCTRLSE